MEGVARHHQQKGIERAIDTLRLVAEKNKDVIEKQAILRTTFNVIQEALLAERQSLMAPVLKRTEARVRTVDHVGQINPSSIGESLAEMSKEAYAVGSGAQAAHGQEGRGATFPQTHDD